MAEVYYPRPSRWEMSRSTLYKRGGYADRSIFLDRSAYCHAIYYSCAFSVTHLERISLTNIHIAWMGVCVCAFIKEYDIHNLFSTPLSLSNVNLFILFRVNCVRVVCVYVILIIELLKHNNYVLRGIYARFILLDFIISSFVLYVNIV